MHTVHLVKSGEHAASQLIFEWYPFCADRIQIAEYDAVCIFHRQKFGIF